MDDLFAARNKRSAVRTYGIRNAKRRAPAKSNDRTASTTVPDRYHTPEADNRSRARPSHESPSTAAASSPTSTPASAPSTPRRRGRQASTPSSSPHVKLDLGKEVFQLLSPKKSKGYRTYGTSDDDDNNGSDEDYSSLYTRRSQASVAARFASTSSFASRMAPKAARRAVSRPVTPPYGVSVASESRVFPVTRSACPSPGPVTNRDWQAADFLRLTKGKVMRTFGDSHEALTLMRGQNETPTQQTELAELTAPPDVTAMRARWTDLDEMESEEEEDLYVRSITRLRSAGGNRRFMEEFDYLVSDLHPKQRLAAKQSTCADIVRRVIGLEDGDELDGEVTSTLTTSSFLANIGAADVTERLCASLRAVRTSQQPDILVDTAIAIIYSQLAADVNLLRQLTARADFILCLSGIVQTQYTASPSTKTTKNLSNLLALVRRSDAPELAQHVTANVIAARALLRLLSHTDLGIQPEEWGIAQMMQALWRSLEEAADKDAISLLASKEILSLVDVAAQCLDVILGRFSTRNHPSQRAAEFATITKLIAVLSRDVVAFTGGPHAVARTAALSSCLKLLVEKMRLCSENIDLSVSVIMSSGAESATAPDRSFIGLTAELLDTCARGADGKGEDMEHNLRLLDVGTLALGVLTKLLETEPQEACSGLLSSEQRGEQNIVRRLGRLFSEREGMLSKTDETGLFAHCLAVALSLMVVGAQEMDGDAEASGKRIVSELSIGMSLRPEQRLQHVLADNLDRFAALTSSATPFDRRATSAPEEDSLVRHLSSCLRDT